MVYVPVSWLQAVHYYYFSTGIFSFAAGVAFSSFPSYAALFIVSYVLNSAVSWYLSWWIHRKVKQQIILNYRRYFMNHVVFAVASVAALALVFLPGVTGDPIPEFMDVVLGFNYFAFFTAVMWSVALRFDVLNKAFATYNSVAMSRARAFVIETRGKLKVGTLVPPERFSSYKPGGNDRLDSIFMEVWKGRKSPNLKLSLMKLELAMCEAIVDEMTKRIHEMGHAGNVTENDVIMISNYQKLIDKYSKESYLYEKRMQQEEAQHQ